LKIGAALRMMSCRVASPLRTLPPPREVDSAPACSLISHRKQVGWDRAVPGCIYCNYSVYEPPGTGRSHIRGRASL